ncbi:MAG: sigma-70 family RNA polymerase sigma factor [Phycisphaerales bacterium]|jgi:RNA polymerase sigma factor (TIGR02999 family)|nr:sigma-70 family RNA polymerase sigma factor [Phycisphaerales bacterium]
MDAFAQQPEPQDAAVRATGEVTRLLEAVGKGELGASDQLLPLVYHELRRLAAARLRSDRPGATLQPTALVHEAYLRLVGDEEVRWQGHAHFFGAAALAMKRILIDRARRKQAEARAVRNAAELESDADPEAVDILALDSALEKLATLDERAARVVHLRFFAGLSVEQTAEVLESSERTVKRDWNFARAWLRQEMGHGPNQDMGGDGRGV